MSSDEFEQVDAATLEPRDLFRIEYVIPGIDRRGRPEDVVCVLDVVADPGRAPHVIDCILIAGIVARQPVGDLGPGINEVRQLRLVELLKNAGHNLPGEKIPGRHHNIIAGFASQQLGLERIVGVEGVVADLYAGLFGEVVEHGRVDIIRPVVEIDDALGLRRNGTGGDRCRDRNNNSARFRDTANPTLACRRAVDARGRGNERRMMRSHSRDEPYHVSVGNPAAFQARIPPAR